MYQEEEMQEQPITAREMRAAAEAAEWRSRVMNGLTELTRRLDQLEMREENPLTPFGENYAEIARENTDLKREVVRLRSRLQMMQAGYNAIATIQARLDANEQEMGGNRCCTG